MFLSETDPAHLTPGAEPEACLPGSPLVGFTPATENKPRPPVTMEKKKRGRGTSVWASGPWGEV